MKMSLAKQYNRTGFDTRNTTAIRRALPYLREHGGVEEWVLPLDDAHVYAGAFYGLLNRLGVTGELWYPLLILNGYLSSGDYKGEKIIKKYINDDIVTNYIDIISAKLAPDLTDV